MCSLVKAALPLLLLAAPIGQVEVFEVSVIEGARPAVFKQAPRQPRSPRAMAERVKTRPMDLAPRTFRSALKRSKDVL